MLPAKKLVSAGGLCWLLMGFVRLPRRLLRQLPKLPRCCVLAQAQAFIAALCTVQAAKKAAEAVIRIRP